MLPLTSPPWLVSPAHRPSAHNRIGLSLISGFSCPPFIPTHISRPFPSSVLSPSARDRLPISPEKRPGPQTSSLLSTLSPSSFSYPSVAVVPGPPCEPSGTKIQPMILATSTEIDTRPLTTKVQSRPSSISWKSPRGSTPASSNLWVDWVQVDLGRSSDSVEHLGVSRVVAGLCMGGQRIPELGEARGAG